jgi:hypothetical protein
MGKANSYFSKLPFTKEQLALDYAAGLTQGQLAARYRTTQKVVWKAMVNFGIQARPKANYGPLNGRWKGSSATYGQFHRRVRTLRGKPQKCEVCGTVDLDKTYEWANLTGRYDDPDDYRRMCVSCHRKHDNWHLKLKALRNGA